MNIDKFKQPDGSYLGEDDCSYRDAIEFIMGMFDFCGCGMPEKCLTYILKALVYIHSLKEDRQKPSIFGSDGEAYFVYYVLDKLELTEHGISVPGWLTEKGEELMADLLTLEKDGSLG
jgi:hypothetical protein